MNRLLRKIKRRRGGDPLDPNTRALVNALRSGEYQQTRSVLRRGDSYCCLGVACDISGKGRWVECLDMSNLGYDTPGQRAGWDRQVSGPYYAETSFLPHEVTDWLGWKNRNPVVTSDGRTLASLNDAGYSFAQIADLIENNYESIVRRPA